MFSKCFKKTISFTSRILLLLVLPWINGCDQDMANQPKYEPLELSTLFTDFRSARQPVPGTVARGELREDTWLYKGVSASGDPVESFPMKISQDVIEEGQINFNIYCSPCHGLTGYGDGMIVQRGFMAPPSYHTEQLRQMSPGHIFQVITNGLGGMPAYDNQIPAKLRWAIVAYVQALQKSQNVPFDELPPEVQRRLMKEQK